MASQPEDHGTMEIDTPPHVDVSLPNVDAVAVDDMDGDVAMADVGGSENNSSRQAPSNGPAASSFKQGTASFFKPKAVDGSSSAKSKGKEPASGENLGLDDPLRAGLPW